MNEGEKNELLFKIYLCYLKGAKDQNSPFGLIESLGFDKINFNDLPQSFDFSTLQEEEEILNTCKNLNIGKSSSSNKADVEINGIKYSVKFINAAPPSIINHTTRKGFLRIANKLNLNINDLDEIINQYWDLRIAEKITEDCGNNNSLSPFKDNKEILRPYLEYFCFSGTGKADSKNQADSLVKFKTFNDTNTWKIYSKSETVDEIWSGLYFCMRDISKGGVKDYENNPEKNIIEPWTRYSSDKYRGALSVRYKSSG